MPSRADDDDDVNRFKEVMVVRPNLDCEWIFCCNFDGPASEDTSTPSRPGAICLDWAKRNSSTRVRKEPSKSFQRRGPRTGDGISLFAGALKSFRPRRSTAIARLANEMLCVAG